MAPASPAKQNEAQWPPRSPHEALLSTPRGRERYRRMMDQTSPTPSPSKRARNLPSMNLLAEIENDDEDEDEETLELKLQEIQARLRLKKLQSAKSKKTEGVEHLHTTTSELAISTQVRTRSTRATTPTEEDKPAISQNQVQVPASPVRRFQAPQPQTSPSRVLLGIDKGLKAKDISLKRAPSYRDSQTSTEIGHTGYLRRSRTTTSVSSTDSRPLSFNERLASVRTEEAARTQRQEKIQKLRSNAFGIGSGLLERRDLVEHQACGSTPKQHGANHSICKPGELNHNLDGQDSEKKDTNRAKYLKSRLPDLNLTQAFTCRRGFYLTVVKAPDFALPDVEQDIVVFGILAKKSEPRAHKPTQGRNGKAEDRGKYMVMTLVDLEWELDLFLFNSGFTRHWKLTEGTVIAILNPTLMPPPPGRYDTGRFSLVINSDDDSIIEIGTARDLGGCQSIKKDGDLCGAWINKKRTHHCEFHSNEAIRKQRATRMEVNGTSFGARKNNSKEVFGWGQEKKPESSRKYDWETKTHWFASRTMSAADLIDGKDRTPNDRKERAEFLKRDLEAKEREREMMKKLGQVGNAAGREYMRQAGSRITGASSSMSQGSNSMPTTEEIYRPDAKSLGLVGRLTSRLALASSSRSAFGWGSNLKDKLAKMKEGEKLRKDEPPVRKKTRFVTDKGIREAGRESLGNELAERQVTLEDDDDDELVIV
ncbi:hypothetical protein NM208_g10475 [Fusarium decemcellulare]|uniref:Uncharacterized protein n=1 Tax=Fusarium decemcellulare TaxID=57161 RepID=A0ACC1RXS1_9HYPO|nr:hypothetical protein NM208_g10475 [Fusarium decemcellulare]